MKSRLWRIDIRNFKAFREFTLDLEGRHLLVYGPNGSGKSSLYWALYTFLQSARKKRRHIAKYFNPGDPEHLLNIYEQAEAAPQPGEISLTLREVSTKIDTTYRISQADHGTYQQPAILKGDLASDFITYRFFFRFSHFRNSEKFDIWPIFEREILPFCVSTGGKVPLDCWNAIKAGNPNPHGRGGVGARKSYDEFKRLTQEFATMLPGIVDAISTEAQGFYEEHFAESDPAKVSIKLGVTTNPDAVGTGWKSYKLTKPAVEFGIQVGGKTINRPQVFLNEAKLTQLALSVRFAASRVNLHQSDLKLLVLDDLLVSLDMSNRMKVVEILLSDSFSSYQKIVLTHELGFFREFRRTIGASHPEWCFLRLEGNAASSIAARSDKTDLQKAEDYLHGHDLDEAALCLRKACEDTAQRFIGHQKVIPTKEFMGLANVLRIARKRLLAELPVKLHENVLSKTPDAYLQLLVPANDDDLDANDELDIPTRGRLKTNRARLRRLIKDEYVELLSQVALIDQILACTERVLNPAAHAGNPPLYEQEVEHAIDLVKKLEQSFA